MILPTSYTAVLIVALVSLLLGSLWAFMARSAGKWRFELLGIDFGLGAIAGALLIGFTVGTFGQEITFYDNLNIMRKSSLMFLIAYGAFLNLGMMLLLGALSLSGVAATFLTGLSMAAVSAAIGMHLALPDGNLMPLLVGAALFLVAAVLSTMSHSERVRQRDTELLQKAVAAGLKGKLPPSAPLKASVLAIIGGLLLGLAQPVTVWAQNRDEIGFGAYAVSALFAAAFMAGTPFFSLFFLNLPVQGEALSFSNWARGTGKQHMLGFSSGLLWVAGIIAMLLAATSAPALGVGKAITFALPRAVVLIGAVAGIFVFGEFAAYHSARTKAMAALGAAVAGLAVFFVGLK